jgi:hypothetical protein
MGRVQSRFKGIGESARFGFAAKGNGVLVQTDLPLGFCQFFYQDLHYRRPPQVKDCPAEVSIVDPNWMAIMTRVNLQTDGLPMMGLRLL